MSAKSFIEMMDAEYVTLQRDILLPDGTWKKLSVDDRVMQLTAPDGDALCCGLCGYYAYVQPKMVNGVLCVACLRCRRAVYKWMPLKVLCAAASHNDNGGCRNPLCWKYGGKK